MADTHEDTIAGHDPAHEHGPNLKVYLTIAVALAVFTAVSFVVNVMVRPTDHGGLGWLSPTTGFLVILSVAIAKATLVGMFFMHVKYDWGNLYFLIIPAFILAT